MNVMEALPNRRILVIDDNPAIHDDFRKVLTSQGAPTAAVDELEAELFGSAVPSARNLDFEIDSAMQGEEGLAKVRAANAAHRPYAMAFVDVRMPPGWDGVETIARIWNEYPELQVVICTAYSDYSWDEMITKLCRRENLLILKKPFDNIEVLQIASALTEKWHVSQQARMKLDQLEEVIAERTRTIQIANEELRAMTDELVRARDAAEAANAAKARFLANVSHEIRTPLTAVLGYADLLLENEQSVEQRTECVQIIRRHGDNLLQIINDILDLSKIEAGRMSVERIPCSPADIVREVLLLLGIRARLKGLTLSIECRDTIPSTIQSDPVRLRQILTNLVGNAIKFTHEGSIRVVMRLIGRAPFGGDERSDSHLEFAVIDSGIGIPPESLGQLFTPFTQGNESTSRRFGGTGLGLAISKKLVEALGGEIVAESNEKYGSVFRFTVQTGPLKDVALIGQSDLGALSLECEPPLPRTQDSLTCRVLLAEDGADNQRLIAHILRSAGATVDLVDNGRSAVEAALSGVCDIVIMDMQMPELDGYAATTQLREAGYRGPIIALTAHAMSTDRRKCLDAGCDDYQTKPINRRSLIETVARHVSRASRQPAPRSDAPLAV